MPRPTIRCSVCSKWKLDSIDAGPCDECINGHADGIEADDTATAELADEAAAEDDEPAEEKPEEDEAETTPA